MIKALATTSIITFILAASVSILSIATVASAQAVTTCSIYSTASSGSGQPVTISWNSSNATYAFLNPGGSVATNGSQVVYPTVTTTYTLTVNGAQGQSSNCQVTVQVGSTSGLPYCSISAGTTNLNPGSAVTLTWNSSNANSASLTNVGSVSTSGSQTVYPWNTTTYILTVNNSLGQSSNCQTTVYVGSSSTQAPSCWITISNNNQYNYNQQATLSWGSTNATSASINPSVGSVSTSGSQTIYTSGNQIYTMTVYNAQGQSATCQTSSYYQPGILSCTITANPVNIQNGSSSYLSWTSTGASSAYLNDGLGNVAPNGSLTVRPENSRNYILTVIGSNGAQQTCTTFLSVSGSYLPLNQIPYTGFDLGPIGNTMYWFALALFAVAAGYLIVYFMPLSRMRSTRSSVHAEHVHEATIISERVTVPAIFSNKEPKFSTEVRAYVEAPENLPVLHSERHEQKHTELKDSMSFAESKEGGAPSIFIGRA